jgi:hypothetical protein
LNFSSSSVITLIVFVFLLTFYFYFATYNKMVKNSTNVRRCGEKVTHVYPQSHPRESHSIDALSFFSLTKEVPGLCRLFSRRGGFWGRVRELRIIMEMEKEREKKNLNVLRTMYWTVWRFIYNP